MNNPNDASHQLTPPAQKPKEKKKKPSQPPKAPLAARSGKAITTGTDSNKPANQFTYVLGPQEKALHDYLRCVFNPEKYQARVPADTGGFELYTQLWKTQESGTAVADTAGNAVLGLCCSSWLENSNADGVPDPTCQILGYSANGAAVMYSNGAGLNAGKLPAVGANFASASFSAVPLVGPTDTALTATTRIRLVACSVRVHSVMAQDNSRGELMFAGTVNPSGGALGGALNGSSWSDLKSTNDAVVTRAVRTLSNWKSDETFTIVAIPGEAQCFEMCVLPANGYNSSISLMPPCHIAALARGMVAGDSFSFDVTYVWESELAKTFSASEAADRPVPIPSETLSLASVKAKPYQASNMNDIHALPWVETLSSTNPMAMAALERHPDVQKVIVDLPKKRPSKLPITYSSGPSFLDNLAGVAKTGLKFLGSNQSVAKIPVIGGAISGIASVLSSLFD